MKKLSFLLVTVLFAFNLSKAQSLADAIKLVDVDFKEHSTEAALSKLYAANPKDPKVIYWYVQAIIAGAGEPSSDALNKAKQILQQSLNDGINSPLLWVASGHIQLLENNDVNSAKQKFEQAITSTKNKKGNDPEILTAIGKANSDGGSAIGDPNYGIEKLKEAGSINKTDPNIYIYMGLCYRKLGSDYGGAAVEAFIEAINRDKNCAKAYYQIGKIYQSQNNKDALEENYNKTIKADPTFAPVYYSLYKYYAEKDVNKAKECIDNFLKYADNDPINDLEYADYLYRAGIQNPENYKESITKLKALESTVGTKKLPLIDVIYAYDYDKIGDSVQARSYIEKFLSTAPETDIQPDHYTLGINILSKFPGTENTVIGYIQKAISSDTVKANKINFAGKAADLMENTKNYSEEIKWLKFADSLKGTMGEYEYYKLSATVFNAKDYQQMLDISDKYIAAFPDKPQGYYFKTRAAHSIDTNNTTGLYFNAINQQNAYLEKDTATNKQTLINNYYALLSYYNDVQKDYSKALEVCDKVLTLIPNEPQTLQIRQTIEKNMKVNGGKAQDSTIAKPKK